MDYPIFPSDLLVSKYSIPFRPTIFGKIDFEGTNRISGEAALMRYKRIVLELKEMSFVNADNRDYVWKFRFIYIPKYIYYFEVLKSTKNCKSWQSYIR